MHPFTPQCFLALKFCALLLVLVRPGQAAHPHTRFGPAGVFGVGRRKTTPNV